MSFLFNMGANILATFLFIYFATCLDGELTMNRVELDNNGIYKCMAGNTACPVESTVNIADLVKPQIYELLNLTSSTGNELRLLCKANGYPSPRVTFRKLSNSNPYRPGIQDSDSRIVLEQGEGFGTLIISNLARSDDGLYQCIAENPAGTAYKNGHITVWFKPTFNRTRELPPVWSWDGRPGNLTCQPEAIPNATISWRFNQLEISEENFDNGRIHRNNLQIIGRSPSSVLIVKPYDRRWFYTFYECIARNTLGEASIKIQLKQGFVPTAVNQARAHTVTATTIKFEIVPPANFDGLPIRSYHVQYKPELQQSWDNALTHTWSYDSPYILEHLVPTVTYHFRFAAENDVGRGPWTNFQSMTMPKRSEPAQPTFRLSSSVNWDIDGLPEVKSSFSNHFELQWNVPADNGKPIEYYLIRYCVVSQEGDCSDYILQSIQYTNFQLDRLTPATLYKVELRAHNAIGDSTTAQMWLRTAEAERQQYYNTEIVRSGSDVICVNFIFCLCFCFVDLLGFSFLM